MYLEVKHKNLDIRELVASHWKLQGPLWRFITYIQPYRVSPLQSSPIQSPKVLRGHSHDWEWARLWFQSISPPHWCFKYVKTLSIICLVEWRKRIHVTDLSNLWKIHRQPQNFGTSDLLLLFFHVFPGYAIFVQYSYFLLKKKEGKKERISYEQWANECPNTSLDNSIITSKKCKIVGTIFCQPHFNLPRLISQKTTFV